MSYDTSIDDTEFRDAVIGAVKGLGSGDTKVVDAEVERVEDLTDSEAWRVTLFLPRPSGKQWDVIETLRLKRDARRILDEEATRHGVELEGLSTAWISSREAPAEDTAPPDEPEADERPDSEGHEE